MKLTVYKRDDKKKGTTKKLRAEGYIPAIIYGKEQESQMIYIEKIAFEKGKQHIEKNHLSTTVFELEGDKIKCKAILKGIDYQVTSYDVLHLDFLQLQEKIKINVKVPIVAENRADCVGVKQGGSLRQVLHSIRVSCLPKDIPSQFAIDVKGLSLLQSMRLNCIAFPKEVKALAKMDEVAFVVAKR